MLFDLFSSCLAQALSTTETWGKEGMSEEEKKRLEEVENNPQLQMGMKFMKSGGSFNNCLAILTTTRWFCCLKGCILTFQILACSHMLKKLPSVMVFEKLL